MGLRKAAGEEVISVSKVIRQASEAYLKLNYPYYYTKECRRNK